MKKIERFCHLRNLLLMLINLILILILPLYFGGYIFNSKTSNDTAKITFWMSFLTIYAAISFEDLRYVFKVSELFLQISVFREPERDAEAKEKFNENLNKILKSPNKFNFHDFKSKNKATKEYLIPLEEMFYLEETKHWIKQEYKLNKLNKLHKLKIITITNIDDLYSYEIKFKNSKNHAEIANGESLNVVCFDQVKICIRKKRRGAMKEVIIHE